MNAKGAIQYLEQMANGTRIVEYRRSLSLAIAALQEQEERRWIPVTERLPEKNGEYICRYGFDADNSDKYTGILCYFATDKNPHWQHESMGLICSSWMPLPEPPKEGTIENP